MKQGLKQSRVSSRVENLGKDGDEITRCFSFIDLTLLLIRVIKVFSKSTS